MAILRTYRRFFALLTLLASFAFALPAAAALATQPDMAIMPAVDSHCHDCRAYCAAVAGARAHAPLPNAVKISPFAAVTASTLVVVVPPATEALRFARLPQIVRPPSIPIYLQNRAFLK